MQHTNILHEPPIEFWTINMHFSRAGKYINHPANLPPPPLTCTHVLSTILYLVTLIGATVKQESWDSVSFQPVLKAYPTPHSWIITSHISLGNLEKQWKTFVHQIGRMQQVLNSLKQKSLGPTYINKWGLQNPKGKSERGEGNQGSLRERAQ